MALLPLSDRRYLKHRGISYEEVEQPQRAVVLKAFDLPPDRFDAANADFLIMLPAGYPDCAPDMFYAFPWLRLRATAALPRQTDQTVQFGGRSWQRWSRHNNEWRPGVDGIRTMVKRIEAALLEAA